MKKSQLKQLIRETIHYILSEEVVGYTDKNMEKGVYKNPQTIKKLDKNARTISTPDFDLYVTDDPYNFTHDKLSTWLRQQGISCLPLKTWKGVMLALKRGYMTWIKKGDKFVPSSLYEAKDIQQNWSELDRIAFKLNKKFNYKFELESYYGDSIDDEEDEW